LINFGNIDSHNWHFKKGKYLALKILLKKWQNFWKMIFGNIFQIWHHLATLLYHKETRHELEAHLDG